MRIANHYGESIEIDYAPGNGTTPMATIVEHENPEGTTDEEKETREASFLLDEMDLRAFAAACLTMADELRDSLRRERDFRQEIDLQRLAGRTR